MKKTLSLLLALVMCLTLLPTVTLAASGDAVGADELEITNQNYDFGTVNRADGAKGLSCTVTVKNVSDRTLYYPHDNRASYFNTWGSTLFEAKGDLMGKAIGTYNCPLAKLAPGESTSMTITLNERAMNAQSGQKSYTYKLKFSSYQGERYLEMIALPGYEPDLIDKTKYTEFPITVSINLAGEARSAEIPSSTAVQDDELVISTRSINFGNIVFGEKSIEKTIEIKNVGDRVLFLGLDKADDALNPPGAATLNNSGATEIINTDLWELRLYPGKSTSVAFTYRSDETYDVEKYGSDVHLETNLIVSPRKFWAHDGQEYLYPEEDHSDYTSLSSLRDEIALYKLTADAKFAEQGGEGISLSDTELTATADLPYTVKYSGYNDKTGWIEYQSWPTQIYTDYITITNNNNYEVSISSTNGKFSNSSLQFTTDPLSRLKPGESEKIRCKIWGYNGVLGDNRETKTVNDEATLTIRATAYGSPTQEQTVKVRVALNFINKTVDNPLAEKPSFWAEAEVTEAINAKLVPATLQSKYTQPTTRLEFCMLATTLYETALGKTITERATFTDTTNSYVEKMAGLGVVNGVGNNRFDPNAQLTREQAATMLARLANVMGKPMAAATTNFGDNAKISSWAKEAVGQVQKAGVMNGVGNNMFSPQTNYTREQSILTILRTFHYFK